MSIQLQVGLPGFALTPGTANAGTVITALVPPWPGPKLGAPSWLFQMVADGQGKRPNWFEANSNYITHVCAVLYTTAATAHTVTVMRPLNFTYFPAGLPNNRTAISNGSGSSSTGLFSDPGAYSTSYLYPLPAGLTAPAQVADHAITTGDYVAYQLADGTWQLDTIASGSFNSSLTLTAGTPNRTNGNIPAGGPLFYFGTTALSNPLTGKPHLRLPTVAGTTRQNLLPGNFETSAPLLWPSDPVLVVSNNITNAGTMDLVSGTYSEY
jgi:hypothetical protein